MWRRWIAHLSIGSGVVALGVLTWGMASVPTQQRNPTVPAGRTDTPLNLPLHVIGISFTARRVENLAINNIGRDLKLFHDTRTALDTMHTAMSNLRGEPPQCPAPLCPDCGVPPCRPKPPQSHLPWMEREGDGFVAFATVRIQVNEIHDTAMRKLYGGAEWAAIEKVLTEGILNLEKIGAPVK